MNTCMGSMAPDIYSHGHSNFATLLFTEDALTPGTMVSPYIEPSAPPVPFLCRDVSDSLPLSTTNFSMIMSTFGPMASALSMTPRDMWSTERTCEHPHGVEGEQHACAASIESMVELAASVLGVGTRDLRRRARGGRRRGARRRTRWPP